MLEIVLDGFDIGKDLVYGSCLGWLHYSIGRLRCFS